MKRALPFDDNRPAIALARDYRDGMQLATHMHDRAQLLYGLTGLVVVSTNDGAWMMPPDRGLWIPAGQLHEVRMVGSVRMRNLYLRQDAISAMPSRCTVLAITDLVRQPARRGDAAARAS